MTSTSANVATDERKSVAWQQRIITVCFFASGYASLGYQLLFFRILTATGLSSGLSVALSLTGFVSLAGIGALIGQKIFRHVVYAEATLGILGVVFVAPLIMFGPEVLFSLVGHTGIASRAILIGIPFAAISLVSGALIPLYERHQTFTKVYGYFHAGGLLAVVVFQWILFQTIGWPATGALMGALSLVIAATLFISMPGEIKRLRKRVYTPCRADNTKIAALFGISVVSGMAGQIAYSSAQYFIGPHITLYGLVTAAVFMGLALASWISSRVRISFTGMAIATSLGAVWLYLVPLVAATAIPTPSEYFDTVFTQNLLCTLIVGVMVVPAMGLIGVLAPAAVREGIPSSLTLFVISIGNALGYWAYLMLSSMVPDTVIWVILIAPLALSVQKISKIAGLLVFTAAGLSANTVTLKGDHNIALHEARIEWTTGGQVRPIDITRSWEKWGWANDITWRDGDPRPKLVISGYVSLTLTDYSFQSELLAGVIPSLLSKNLDKATVIGAGTGMSASGVDALFSKVNLVDLGPLTPDILNYFGEQNHNVYKKTKFHKADGISYLASLDEPQDLIFSTISGAGYTFSSLLYTQEFFELTKEHLTPSGVFSFWLDIRARQQGYRSIIKALKNTYKNVRYFVVHPRPTPLIDRSEDAFDPEYFVVVASNKALNSTNPMPEAVRGRAHKAIYHEWSTTSSAMLNRQEVYFCPKPETLLKVNANRMATLNAAYMYRTDTSADIRQHSIRESEAKGRMPGDFQNSPCRPNQPLTALRND